MVEVELWMFLEAFEALVSASSELQRACLAASQNTPVAPAAGSRVVRANPKTQLGIEFPAAE